MDGETLTEARGQVGGKSHHQRVVGVGGRYQPWKESRFAGWEGQVPGEYKWVGRRGNPVGEEEVAGCAEGRGRCWPGVLLGG